MPRVTLRKQLGRAIRGGHPWIYRDALAGNPRLADGALVLVAGGDARPLARGFWDATSPIAVRILSSAGEIDLGAELDRRIAAALSRRLAALDRAQTNAFRWIHGEADALPGIHADVYGRALTLRYDGRGARAFYRDLPDRLRAAASDAGLPLEAIVERRPRGGSDGDEGARAVFGALPEGEIEVRENGLAFGADLRRGQKGGLFLDQRDNRALVRTLARDCRVLNLFGYTGAFSVYAAAGGARQTTTVDVAAPAIAAARRNFERNHLSVDPQRARFAAEDAFAFLDRAAAAGERYDLVISDPPSFAPNRRVLPTGLRAYQRLHRLCAAVTAPGGILCAASCSSHVGREAFVATVRDGAREAGRRAKIVEIHGAAVDHPVLSQFPEGDYLKFAVVNL
jgi:23S rRNA (cytosine1962-C5)-methyltransferase